MKSEEGQSEVQSETPSSLKRDFHQDAGGLQMARLIGSSAASYIACGTVCERRLPTRRDGLPK